MRFNSHSDVRDKHAFLSPSAYHWLNYDENKLEARYHARNAAVRGTDLHALAHEAIRLGVKLTKGEKALAAYVNDGINYRMTCEPTLFYSYNCFGTPDTICFRRKMLRIHDLKTGIVQASFKQLELYAAIFCLEYGVDPNDISIELRIYQREDVRIHRPHPDTIYDIMDRIVKFDHQVEMMKMSDEL